MSAKDNFDFITKHEKDFIAALKSNRLFATSLEYKHNGEFISVSELELSDKQSIRGYVKGYDNEVVIVRLIFTNKDGSTGVLNLIYSYTDLDVDAISTIYEKLCKVEEFHKSLKHNVDLAKSPNKTISTQSNHIYLSVLSFFKFECLQIKHKINHFALRSKLLIKANQIACAELQYLKSA